MADQNDGRVVIDTELDSTGFESGSDKLTSAVQSLGTRVSTIGANVRDAISTMMERMRPPADVETAARQQTEAYTELDLELMRVTEQAARAEAELSKLYDRQAILQSTGVDENSAQWRRLSAQVQAAEERVRGFQSQANQLRAEGAHTYTEEYAATAQQAEKAESSLSKLYDRQALMEQLGVDKSSTGWRRLAEMIKNAENEIASCHHDMQEMREDGSGYADPEAATSWEKLADTIESVRQRVAAAVSSIGKSVTSAIGSGAKALARGLFNGIKKGAETAVSGLKKLISHTRNAGSGTNALVRSLTSLRTMLTSRIKRAFISQVISSFTDGIKALVQYSSAFDAAMSNMRNRMTELGANISVSFSNLVLAIEPIITRVIDAVSAAVTKLNALLAQLRGESTVIVAKKQTASYADSLRDTANNAKKAEQAQKKLNAALGPYDEIHKLADNSADTASASDAGAGASEMFTSVPVEGLLGNVPESLRAAFDRIKQAVEEQNWYGVGAAIGDGLSAIINAGDAFILAYTPKAAEWATAVAQGLNGLTEHADFAALGTLIADGLNLALEAANAFLTTYNWAALGGQISAGINGFIENFNWEGAGATIGNGIQGVLTTLFEIIKNTHWGELGQDLMAGVSAIFGSIHWDELGQGLAAAFNGVVDFLAGAIERADFSKAAENLATTVNNFFENADFSKAGETFGEAIKKILTGVATFLEEVEWEKVGEDIAEFIKGLDWAGIAEALAELLGAAIAAVPKLLWSFFTTLTEDLSKELEETFESMDTGFIGTDIILGILVGIGNALIGIANWIKDHIFKPFIDGIKKVFGIHSPSKEMQPLGDNISAGLLAGIKAGWTGITTFLSNALTGIKNALSGAWSGIKSAATTAWSGITTGLSTAWSGIKSTATTAWSGISSTVSEKFGKLKDALGKSDLVRAGKNLINSFAGGVYENFKTLHTTAVGKLGKLRDAFSNTDFSRIGANIVNGMKNGITNAWDTLKNKFSSLCDGLVGGVKDFFGIHSPSTVFAEIGENLSLGLEAGISAEERGLLRTTGSIAQAVTDEMQAGLRPGKLALDQTTGSAVLADADRLGTRLAMIADQLAAIAEAFRGITLALPAPALGTVIPARTRIADAAIEPQGGSRVERMLGRLIDLLTEQAATGNRVQVTVPVQIDRRQIGNAVAEFNLSRNRATNGGARK